MIAEERLSWLDTATLARGAHHPNPRYACVMEAVAYVAGEEWSDRPECASPVIGAFLRSWNDMLPDDDRQAFLKPLVPRLIGTNTSPEHEEARAWMVVDWMARECAPAFLRLAGLDEHAERLEGLDALTGGREAEIAQPALDAARNAAWDAARNVVGDAARNAAKAAAGEAERATAWAAAKAAAGAAAWDAARATARDVAWAAAWDAARDAARDAVGAAAGGAAWAAAEAAPRNDARDAAKDAAETAAWNAAETAAWAAATDALAPTVRLAQQSALRLVERMIEVSPT